MGVVVVSGVVQCFVLWWSESECKTHQKVGGNHVPLSRAIGPHCVKQWSEFGETELLTRGACPGLKQEEQIPPVQFLCKFCVVACSACVLP